MLKIKIAGDEQGRETALTLWHLGLEKGTLGSLEQGRPHPELVSELSCRCPPLGLVWRISECVFLSSEKKLQGHLSLLQGRTRSLAEIKRNFPLWDQVAQDQPARCAPLLNKHTWLSVNCMLDTMGRFLGKLCPGRWKAAGGGNKGAPQ